MSNLVELITQLATAMGTDVKTLNAEIEAVEEKQGDLTTLTTASKATLVGAINELKTGLGDAQSEIVDVNTIQGMIDSGLTSIVDGAPEALNTLNEIATALAEDDSVMDGILLALAKRVRVDAEQTFTEAEKAQGRGNIGAQDAAKIGDVDSADPLGAFNAAKA